MLCKRVKGNLTVYIGRFWGRVRRLYGEFIILKGYEIGRGRQGKKKWKEGQGRKRSEDNTMGSNRKRWEETRDSQPE